MGKNPEHLSKSVFVEKLRARGYEVLLLTEPLDEIFVQNIRKYKGFKFQDVAKAGLVFGDEGLTPEEELDQQKEWTEKYKPLIDWLKAEASNVVRNGRSLDHCQWLLYSANRHNQLSFRIDL